MALNGESYHKNDSEKVKVEGELYNGSNVKQHSY